MRAGMATGAALAVSAATLIFAPPAVGGGQRDRLSLHAAGVAARAAVLAHSSYHARTTGALHIRTCWRVRGPAVRCSLYAFTANACTGTDPGEVCAQVLLRHSWLVHVRRRAGRTTARVMRTSVSPDVGDA